MKKARLVITVAIADAVMTHMALTGVMDGRNVVWMEPVTDEQYK